MRGFQYQSGGEGFARCVPLGRCWSVSTLSGVALLGHEIISGSVVNESIRQHLYPRPGQRIGVSLLGRDDKGAGRGTLPGAVSSFSLVRTGRGADKKRYMGVSLMRVCVGVSLRGWDGSLASLSVDETKWGAGHGTLSGTLLYFSRVRTGWGSGPRMLSRRIVNISRTERP